MPSYQSEVLADSPLAYWKFDEAPAGAKSETGETWAFGAGITVGKAPLVADGGYSVSGNGSNPIATTPTVPASLSGGNVTLEAWVRLPDANVQGSFVKVGSSANGWGMGIGGSQWSNAGRNLILLTETIAWHPTPYAFTPGIHHVVAVRGATNAVTVYVDGAVAWTGNLSNPIAASTQMGVGGYSESYGFKLSSSVDVDNVALYPSQLSVARISAHYAASSTYPSEVMADSPAVFLRMDETTATGDSGATAADASGNGRALTHNNGVVFGLPSLLGDGSGRSVSYDGADDFSNIASAAWMDTQYASGEVRINVEAATLSGQQFIASRWSGNASANYWLWSVNGGKAEISVYAANATSTVTGATTLTTGLHTLGWSFDGTTLKVFVDGVLDGSLTVSARTIATGSGWPLEVARAAGQVYGKVKVDELSIMGAAISDARFAARHSAAVATAPTPDSFTGTVATTGPKHTAAMAGSVTAAPVTGSVAMVGPQHTAALAGSVAAGPVTGSLDAVGPKHTAAVSDAIADITGAVAATGPKHTAAIVGTIPVEATRLEPWTGDLSRRTRALAVTSGVIDFTPPLSLPPAGVVERPVMRESVVVPALATIDGAVTDPATGQLRVPDNVFAALPRTTGEVGVPRVLSQYRGAIKDATFLDGGQVRLLSDRREEPFGDVSLTVELPQVTSMSPDADSETDDSPLNWTRNRANVEIVLLKSDGTIRRGVWTGHVVNHDGGNDDRSSRKTLTCHGTLWQAASSLHRAPNMLDPTDVGSLVPKALNDVVSRRYPKIPNVSTGIMSRQRGTWSDSQMAFAQDLLSTAQTASGRQWTVAKVEGSRRTYEMRLKKTSPSWTVTNGAPGVTVRLSKDATTIRNVVFGHGVGPDGYAWWNYHYPNLRRDDAPAYPYSSAGTVMSAGSTDAGTSSGEGVSVWQRRARDLGYNVTVNGVFDSDDASAARAIQRRYGLQVDGVVGPQTWAATFDVGGNGGDLSGAIRLPLAADPRTQRYLYNADGSIAGLNPEFDKNVIAYEADIDYGADTTREQGIENSQQIVDRESEPALVGTITLRTDPREGSRLLIPPGDKLTLVGYEGRDRVLHITAVERDWQSLTVTLEVDERARDAMTVQQIRERNREARRDPARRPGNVNRRSRLAVDSVVPFDGESGAGWIPRFAVYGGLWSVIRIPVSEVGRIAKVDVRTDGPKAEFCMALFGRPIQPAHLVKYVGNPLAEEQAFSKNESFAGILDDRFGFIEAFGGVLNGTSSPAGYWPQDKGSGPLTGRQVDTGGLEYVSAKPPWVWVAVYSPSSTFFSGRLLPAPVQ